LVDSKYEIDCSIHDNFKEAKLKILITKYDKNTLAVEMQKLKGDFLLYQEGIKYVRESLK